MNRKKSICSLAVSAVAATLASTANASNLLGLPHLNTPHNNPQTTEKVALGDKLFHDKRFSSTGDVSCATCHDKARAFTDHLRVSEGINKLTGTRNAPTIINSAFNETQFWDGREPDLESQSKQPFLNPVEMALPNHKPILDIVKSDKEYKNAFKTVFGIKPKNITIDHVAMAIASFERSVISGNSPFDQYYFKQDNSAISKSAQRGLEVFLADGRCVSCHMIGQTDALFTDHRFHNIGVGFHRIANQVEDVVVTFEQSKQQGIDVDVSVLTSENTSELGRFALDLDYTNLGAFKTPTLRNIEKTPPYMHDGSLKTLEEVVDFYNNGGRIKETDPVFDYLSGGIKPLNLTDQQKQDLIAFLKTLTSPAFQDTKIRCNLKCIK